jgi:hypothetical protein
LRWWMNWKDVRNAASVYFQFNIAAPTQKDLKKKRQLKLTYIDAYS